MGATRSQGESDVDGGARSARRSLMMRCRRRSVRRWWVHARC